MDIDLRMSQADAARTSYQVDALNKELSGGKAFKTELDKDDFLKILITQLQHQDPTNPMQDKEFIAQMAQFSSLEQMTNMATSFGKLSTVLNSSEAQSLLGRTVEVLDGDKAIYGKVSQVVRGEFPLVMVNGSFYDLDQVSKVEE
ncbi:MAG TPA: flagellar hook assembly protein FlgD [Spirochaetales bacterium]|nr:flagellar hook assembly protein FlgD [Spirochaetaceae bacterium]HOZ71435.1 flagellar hook assembly protein FlgD [Spirochaetales bacterium]HRW22954.1 flagellar hook assembly protein FlgD [Spirochaetia bacterium]HPB65282.1 flagellar hook assembly protein FlgD [Spirochaetales bacterium]HPE88059.1 flagellar hook assembly protein FlgD [Spirochaetales bacterium]